MTVANPQSGDTHWVSYPRFLWRILSMATDGKLPFYVIAVWVVFLISYAYYFITLGMPDLSSWGGA